MWDRFRAPLSGRILTECGQIELLQVNIKMNSNTALIPEFIASASFPILNSSVLKESLFNREVEIGVKFAM